MKKFLFLTMFFLSACFLSVTASAITIPTTDGKAIDISLAVCTGGATKMVGEMNTFDNFRNGNTATMTICNTIDQKYTIAFKASTKSDDASLTFNFINTETNESITQTVSVENNGTWGSSESDFKDYSLSANLPVGTYTLTITFNGPKYTLNAGNFVFSKFDASKIYYYLTTNVLPAGSGSITISPTKSDYDANDEITLTATVAPRYEFVNWTDGNGTILGTNPQYVFNITKDITVNANFKDADLNITVPTTDTNTFHSEYATVNQNGWTSAQWLTDHLDYFTEGSQAIYTIKNTQATPYKIYAKAATKLDNVTLEYAIWNESETQKISTVVANVINTDSWTSYSEITADISELAIGTYKFVVTFHNPQQLTADEIAEGKVVSTANVKDFKFVDVSSTGINYLDKTIIKDNRIYDFSGRQLKDTKRRGIYIINGRKIVVG